MYLSILSLTISIIFSVSVFAQELVRAPAEQPEPPKPLAEAMIEGAQIYYLGEFQGLYGWALIRQGRPEFYYATKDNSAVVMGLLFDRDGEMITNGQLAQLHSKEGDNMFAITGLISSDEQSALQHTQMTLDKVDENNADSSVSAKPLTPAENMFLDIMAANWITFGENGKHELFAFIDPDCPHCKKFIDEAQPYIKDGTLKIRVLPIGVTTESQQKAAMMLAVADPMERLLRYANGDNAALNPPSSINTVAAEKNKSIMLKWNFDVTPVIVYRSGGGDIRLIRGRPRDFGALLRDLSTQ